MSPLQIIKKLFSRLVSSHERKLVFKNFFSLTALQIINLIIQAMTIPYLLRVIGPEKYGLLAFAQATVQYFLIVTDYGFNFSALREISIHKENPQKVSTIFNAVLFIKFILIALGFTLLCALCAWVPKFRGDWLVYLITFSALLGNVLFANFLYQGMEKMHYIFILNLPQLFFTAMIFVVVRAPHDFIYVAVLNSLSAIVIGILGLWNAHRVFKIRIIRPAMSDMLHELKEGWSMFASNAVSTGFSNTRVFAMGLFTNNTLTGYYAVAERMMALVILFPLGLFVQAAYPRLSKIFIETRSRIFSVVQKMQRITTIGYFIALCLLFVFAGPVIHLICGVSYPEVILSFRILTFAIFFIAANAFRIQFLLAAGRRDIVSKIAVVCSGIGICLTFLLVPIFSFKGVATSVIIAEFLTITWTFLIYKNAQKEINSIH